MLLQINKQYAYEKSYKTMCSESLIVLLSLECRIAHPVINIVTLKDGLCNP